MEEKQEEEYKTALWKGKSKNNNEKLQGKIDLGDSVIYMNFVRNLKPNSDQSPDWIGFAKKVNKQNINKSNYQNQKEAEDDYRRYTYNGEV